MPTVSTRVGQLHVEIEGSGPPAVVWHSLFVDGTTWGRLRPALASARTLVLIDGPGHGRNGERLYGTKGASDCSRSYWGESKWRYEGRHVNGQKQEHIDMIKNIRAGTPLNEGVRIAESTLTAIGGRMAAYTGRTIEWDWLLNESDDKLVQVVKEPKAFHIVVVGASGPKSAFVDGMGEPVTKEIRA